MRRRGPLYLLTLVLVFATTSPAMAAPGPPQPDLDQPVSADTSTPEPAPPEKIDTIDVTPVAVPDGRGDGDEVTSSEYFFPYRRSVSPRLGAVLNTEEYADTRRILYLLGFQYLYQTKNLKNYEAGLDLVSDSTGRAHFARRWLHARTRLRPYSKLGAGLKLIPKDGLATGLKLENWSARGAIGLERLLLVPLSLRCELEIAIGPEDIEAILSAGYSWAW